MLTRPEKVGLALLGLLVVAFGGLTVWRSALQQERKTDFGVYARAGYAVRAGQDIYDKRVCDDRGWHYCYPPPFAILMAPLADPFRWDDRTGYLPFWASVAVWYALSVGFVAFAVHAMAKAVLPGEVPGSRRWWYARTVPVYVCLGGIGYTLSRGQVNLLLVALIAGMFAAAVRGRVVASGVWLAGAIALKVIPAFLFLFPLVRREWRAGVGVALGLAVLLGALPAAVWGIDGAVRNDLRVVDAVLLPGASEAGDQTRAVELTNATATDSQSFQAVIHNVRHPHPDREARPPQPDEFTRLAHWAIGGLLTLITVAVGWRRLRPDPAGQLIFLGCLCVLMLHISPVSHMHYYVLALPLVAGLWLKGLAARPGRLSAGGRTVAVLAGWGAVTAAALLPFSFAVWLREMGPTVLATLALWAVGLAEVARRPVAVASRGVESQPEALAA
jgi:hypothetical protein